MTPDEILTKAAGSVTQADRDLASAILRECKGPPAIDHIRLGNSDDHPWVQAFARHRTSATADLLAVVGEAKIVIDYAASILWVGRPQAVQQRPARIDAALRSFRAALTRLDAILAGDAA